MKTRENFYEVSEDFVRWAYDLAFNMVYENRRSQYQNANDLVKTAIEFRMENKNDFIDEMLNSWCLSIDPYDDVDNWFWAEELSYKDILKRIVPDEIYHETEDQIEIIHKWCDNHDFWYSDEYELAVANVFNY